MSSRAELARVRAERDEWEALSERNLLDVERLVEAAQPYLDRAAPHEQLFDGEDLANFERLSAAVKTAQGEKP